MNNQNNIVIVKIGTNILTTEKGNLDLNNLRSLVFQINTELSKNKTQFIIVTSGAITCGSKHLNLTAKSIPEKQAAAATGQVLIMQEYNNFFKQKGFKTGQILLTRNCLENKIKYTNVKNTILTLLKHNIIPIINENDSVATEEIDDNFGDNDELSCNVAQLVQAKKLIILTDIDGLYTANPKTNPAAKLIKQLDSISENTFSHIQDIKNTRSRGGMESKLNSAKKAAESGIEVVIANGRKDNIINNIIDNNFIGTTIKPK
jgi:glutamate 5-kinase